jgi:hypothetical protein
MKKIAFLLGIMFVGIIILLESSGKHKRIADYVRNTERDDDVWLGN